MQIFSPQTFVEIWFFGPNKWGQMVTLEWVFRALRSKRSRLEKLLFSKCKRLRICMRNHRLITGGGRFILGHLKWVFCSHPYFNSRIIQKIRYLALWKEHNLTVSKSSIATFSDYPRAEIRSEQKQKILNPIFSIMKKIEKKFRSFFVVDRISALG